MTPISPTVTMHLRSRPQPGSRSTHQPRLNSQDLFRGTHELIIEHQGQEYRLRLTRNDKLILNK